MKYVVSSVAHDDLLSIWKYSADRWDGAQADLCIEAIAVRLAWLTRNPGLWHARPEFGDDLYSYPDKSHVIILREAHGSLQIIRVLHVSMDLGQHIDR